MFIASEMAWVFIAIELLAGCVIGIAVLAMMYRSRLRLKVVMVGALVASVAFLFVSGIGGWADAHAEFVNGRRVDFASWGEDLRVRNFLAEDALPLATISSALAALLVGVSFRRGQIQNSLDDPKPLSSITK